jgi:beta-mannosidase
MNTKPVIFLCLCCLLFLQFNFTGMSSEKQSAVLSWEVGYNASKNNLPEEWYPAKVPGAVQTDYARAKDWESFYVAENWKDYLWMEDVYWTYRTHFEKPDLLEDELLFFVSEGIDYEFDLLLNGKKLFYQEGMFAPVNLDLTNDLKESNDLLVKIYPAPKLPGFDMNRSQAAQSVKPAVSYGWDWHPRLVPLGIWDETFLEIRNQTFIEDLYTKYKLNDNYTEAEISVIAEGKKLSGRSFEWTLTGPDGKTVFKRNRSD